MILDADLLVKVNVKTLNDIPDGRRIVVNGGRGGQRFIILARDGMYEVTGNRLKLKRKWQSPWLDPDGN